MSIVFTGLSKYIFILTLSLLLACPASSNAAGASVDGLKTENPSQLAFYVNADDECAISPDEVEAIVEGVLIRSRIKPDKDAWAYSDLYMNIVLLCLDTGIGDKQVMKLNVHFGSAIRLPYLILLDHDYGSVTVGDKDYAADAVQDAIERAITVFIATNFDL